MPRRKARRARQLRAPRCTTPHSTTNAFHNNHTPVSDAKRDPARPHRAAPARRRFWRRKLARTRKRLRTPRVLASTPPNASSALSRRPYPPLAAALRAHGARRCRARASRRALPHTRAPDAAMHPALPLHEPQPCAPAPRRRVPHPPPRARRAVTAHSTPRAYAAPLFRQVRTSVLLIFASQTEVGAFLRLRQPHFCRRSSAN